MFTGLVEEIGAVAGIREKSGFRLMEFQADRVLEGTTVGDSICIDGVCQTVTRMDGNRFTVNIIPLTWRNTVLSKRSAGEQVNIEVDIIGRYVARMLGIEERQAGHRPPAAPWLSTQKLKEWGY